MLRDKGFKPKPKTINIIFMNGGVGDHMASLVAVDYISKQYPWIKLLVWVPDFLREFARHLLPDLYVNNYSSMATKYDSNKTTKTTEWDGIVSPMKIHCLDYAFLKLCDENPDIEHKNYLKVRTDEIDITKFNLPEKYVIVTTGYTAEVREFLPEEVNKTAAYIREAGYVPVFVGQKNTHAGGAFTIKGTFKETIDLSVGIDLIDKTTLLEAAAMMAGAAAVIGVDNGLLHVAGCTDVPIVGGFTTVNPETRMPVRNNVLGHSYYPVTPDSSLDCKFCQVKTNFVYGHNYTECLYKDRLCVTQMTANKFINHLKGILN